MTRRKDLRTVAQRRHATPQPTTATPSTQTNQSQVHSQSCHASTKPQQTHSPTTVAAVDDMLFPQPMEIAFSLEAGSFSSDLFFDSSTAASANAPLPNAYVVCFEDILVPMKWMTQHLELRPSNKSIQDAKQRVIRNPYLHESLARIDQFALQLLTSVSSHGPVCILSEQNARFVEAVCQAFFPRLAYCLASPQVLANVQVMGAPRKFETVGEKTTWRIYLMQALVREQLFAGTAHLLMDRHVGRFGLIVVSPHQVDMMACAKALEVAPYLIPKSVRIANAKNLQALDQFVVHLQTLTQWLNDATPCPTPFSVSM